MSSTTTLLNRNRQFAETFDAGALPILPKMRTVIVTCADARVDPAHVLGLDLGDAVVIRNNGGRVTQAVIDEIVTLTFMVANMDGDAPGSFELVLMQHTQCGAERFAKPEFQQALLKNTGIDVSGIAISDHEISLREDVEKLRNTPAIPGYVVVSAFIYDVQHGHAREVIAPAPLSA